MLVGARHGTYVRKKSVGTQIARWYCRESHCLQPGAGLLGGAAAGHTHSAQGHRCGSRASAESDGVRRSVAPRRRRVARRDALGVQTPALGMARPETGEGASPEQFELPHRDHRLPPASRQRYGVGVATLDDRAVATSLAASARFAPTAPALSITSMVTTPSLIDPRIKETRAAR